MHVQSLEDRRLFAATAMLSKGTLNVTGTDGNDTIYVGMTLAYSSGNSGPSASVYGYSVIVNGVKMGLWKASKVKHIAVSGLDGSDRIYGPTTDGVTLALQPTTSFSNPGTTVYVDYNGGTDGGYVSDGELATLLKGKVVGLSMNGGAGNDFLVGGLGNDRLYGGAGKDDLRDAYGRNLLDGGAGSDIINALEVGQTTGQGIPAGPSLPGGTPDTIRGGNGTDRVLANADDRLADVAEMLTSVPTAA